MDVRREMTKTKEQLEEEKKISLSIRIRPLELDGMNSSWNIANVMSSFVMQVWIMRISNQKQKNFGIKL